MVPLLFLQGPLVLFMGKGYNKKPWVTGGEGREAQEAFEVHFHGMLPDGITIQLKGLQRRGFINLLGGEEVG